MTNHHGTEAPRFPSMEELSTCDYGNERTIVVGHMHPDSDSVGSAMAYAYLLNAIGIHAIAATTEPVNHETKYALSVFGIEPPEIIRNVSGCQVILVDHSMTAQAPRGIETARIVGLLDHHPGGEINVCSPYVAVCEPSGAAASLVYRLYMSCKVDIPVNMAQLMLMSILSDTRNMSRNVTETDREAYDHLIRIASIPDINELYGKMARALASYDGMTDEEILESDYKEYEAGNIRFCIGDVNAFGEAEVCKMTERMAVVMESLYPSCGLDMLFLIVNNKKEDDSGIRTMMAACGNGAAELLNQCFGGYDGRRFFLFSRNLSRKTTVAPTLISALEKLGKDEKTVDKDVDITTSRKYNPD
ncbi:MAG: DHH family phosphoesterase [Clostridia bacterium]|nr:DHH family phosphoesterase [Clostridia bacterium]